MLVFLFFEGILNWRIRYWSDTHAFSKHGSGHAFKCLGWPCPATLLFLLLRHQSWHFVSFVSLRNTRCQSTCFGEQLGSKYGTWYSERVTLQFICLGFWAGVTYLRYTVPMSPKEVEAAVSCCLLALQFIVCLYTFVVWLIRSLVDPTLAAFIVCAPLHVLNTWAFLSQVLSSLERVFTNLFATLIANIKQRKETSLKKE